MKHQSWFGALGGIGLALVLCASGCAARAGVVSPPAAATPAVAVTSSVSTQTLVGSWKPADTSGVKPAPRSVLTISANGDWQQYGVKLHYAMRKDGRVDVWYNGAHTIHAVEVQGTTLIDHTPSGTVRRFTRAN